MTHAVDRDVLEDLLDAGLDDWVALVRVGFAIRRVHGLDGAELCDEIARTVTALVDDALFRAGTYDNEHGFRPLDEPLGPILDRVCADWGGIEDARWWEVLWLDLTTRGEEEARRFFPSR